LTYRYHDFDYRTGIRNPTSREGLINTLFRAARNGATIQFVTRDPFAENDPMPPQEKTFWYRGLRTLSDVGVSVRLHKSLHAKVYLIRLGGERWFYAVGSSNLTRQGMGWRWVECNVVGESATDYGVVEKEVIKINSPNKTESLDEWELRSRRSPEGLAFFAR